jgi:hypothetical protein
VGARQLFFQLLALAGRESRSFRNRQQFQAEF